METLGIIDEIEAIVYDKLQVVSYKWLSRNFLVSSNEAKRLLQEFVEKHTSQLEVVYNLSGWLKSDLPMYHIRLVSGHNLSEAIDEFDGECSIQVYSVQCCIPKDPAALWNTEFVQTEALFKQPLTVDNCLRDNRFSGILNPYVKRHTDGAPARIMAPQLETGGGSGPTKSDSRCHSTSTLQPQQKNLQQSSPEDGHLSSDHIPDTKNETEVKNPSLPANKDRIDNSSSHSGGSLANLWDRASAKIKPCNSSAKTDKLVQNAAGPICTPEAVEAECSDDDVQEVNFRRVSGGKVNRKRRVVIDYSDEEDAIEDAVNLASPELPKGKSNINSRQSTKIESEPRVRVKEGKATERKPDQSAMNDLFNVRRGKKSGLPASADHASANDGKRTDVVSSDALGSPKRRKVLKTRIDERGREVTEVVWEGEETNAKKVAGDGEKTSDDGPVTNDGSRLSDDSPVTNNVNRAGVGNKAAATGKAGNKKPGTKDRKQGNILTFFKKA